MCEISNKLKLCTCADTEDLENFWELHIYHEEQEVHVVGMPMLPVMMSPQDFRNKELFLQYLNEGNCFDFPYTPKEKDRLLIALKPSEGQPSDFDSEYIFNGYSYNGQQWQHEEYDTFEWM